MKDRTACALVLAALVAAGAGLRVSAAEPAPAIYTSAQAVAGSREYQSNCAACHGVHLEGGAGPALAGSVLRNLAKDTRLTVGDVFAVAAKQMPLNQPGSLKREQYVAIMAYILKHNGYPAGETPLTYAAALRSNVPMTSHAR